MKILYRTYCLFVLLPVFIVTTAVIATLVNILCPLGNNRWATWYGNASGRIWGRIVVTMTLLPVRFTGRENIRQGESYVFVSNHQGCYDIFLLFGYINVPIRWMMKNALGKVPFIGSSCRAAGEVFVDTSSRAKVKETYIKARHTLRDGVSLMVFPEGQRSRDGRMQPFKRGAFTVANELQLPVVPITVNGPFRVMPRHRDFHFPVWHPLTVTIHEPIYPKGNGSENITYLMTESYKAIHSALDEEFK